MNFVTGILLSTCISYRLDLSIMARVVGRVVLKIGYSFLTSTWRIGSIRIRLTEIPNMLAVSRIKGILGAGFRLFGSFGIGNSIKLIGDLSGIGVVSGHLLVSALVIGIVRGLGICNVMSIVNGHGSSVSGLMGFSDSLLISGIGVKGIGLLKISIFSLLFILVLIGTYFYGLCKICLIA